MKKRMAAITGALAIGLFALFLFFPVHNAQAAAVRWDGGGDGSRWSDPANWSGDTLPTSTDTITIDANPDVRYSVVLDIDFQLDVSGSINVNTFRNTLSVATGVMLTNYGTINNNNGGIGNGGTFVNVGTVEDRGNLRNTASGTLENKGTINIPLGTFSNSGTVTNKGTINSEGVITNDRPTGVFENKGTVINNGDGNGIINSGTFVNKDTVEINTGSTIDNRGAIDNRGTIKISDYGGSGIENSGIIDNRGTMINNFAIFNSDYNDGTIFNRGTIVNNYIVTNYGTIDNTGTIENNGSVDNRCGSTFASSGTVTGNPVNNEPCA